MSAQAQCYKHYDLEQQANRRQKGDFIGEHKDQDSRSDYFATGVFH